jgi:hypothetical protein
VSDRTGLSRGDRNRNARLARLRVLLVQGNAIVGIDLASDKQAAVVTDHDSRVLARRRVAARALELGELLDWALAGARAAGFASVRQWRASRPGTGGGCWTSSPRSPGWRSFGLANIYEQMQAAEQAVLSLLKTVEPNLEQPGEGHPWWNACPRVAPNRR